MDCLGRDERNITAVDEEFLHPCSDCGASFDGNNDFHFVMPVEGVREQVAGNIPPVYHIGEVNPAVELCFVDGFIIIIVLCK